MTEMNPDESYPRYAAAILDQGGYPSNTDQILYSIDLTEPEDGYNNVVPVVYDLEIYETSDDGFHGDDWTNTVPMPYNVNAHSVRSLDENTNMIPTRSSGTIHGSYEFDTQENDWINMVPTRHITTAVSPRHLDLYEDEYSDIISTGDARVTHISHDFDIQEDEWINVVPTGRNTEIGSPHCLDLQEPDWGYEQDQERDPLQSQSLVGTFVNLNFEINQK